MSLTRRRFITISAGLASAGFVLGAVVPAAPARVSTWRGVVLGADAKLIIAGSSEEESRRLIVLVRAEIDRLETIFSLYRPGSVLNTLNRSGFLKAPPAEMLALFSQVDIVHRATKGYFDPTVQPLWAVYAAQAGTPSQSSLRLALDRVGWRKVHYDSRRVEFSDPTMQLTLNGVAQGYVTDRVTALLRAEGLENAVVNIGEISALGHNPEGLPWQIGLAVHGDGDVDELVGLSNQALATSSPVGTTFDGDTGHILNPMNGLPAEQYWERVSVIHPSAAIADGLSTAGVMMTVAELDGCQEIIDGTRYLVKRSDG